MIDVYGILIGAGTGAAIALLGYAKTVKLEGTTLTLEDFDIFKFACTIIFGAVAGAYAQFSGLGYDVASQVIASAGVETFIEYFLKAAWRVVVAQYKATKVAVNQ